MRRTFVEPAMRSNSSVLALALLTLASVGCDRFRKQEERQDVVEEAPKEPPLRSAGSLSDYGSVCSSGSRLASKPYEKHADGAPSKVAVFQKYLDDKTPMYRWTKAPGMGAIQAESDAEKDAVELVACVDLKKKTKSRSQCNFYGGTIERWVMTHTVRIIDPRTAKELVTEEFEIDPLTTGCPGSASFPSGSNVLYEGGEYGGRLVVTLLPLQAEGVGLPELAAHDLVDVCTGTPRPQAARAKLGEARTVYVAYRPEEGFSWGQDARPEGLPSNELVEKNPASAQFVACITGKPETKKQSCDFMMGSTLEIYDGPLEVVVRETATGKVVGTKSFKATSSRCPSTHKFWGAKDPYFQKVEAGVAEFVYGFAGGVPEAIKAKAPKPKAPNLSQMLY